MLNGRASEKSYLCSLLRTLEMPRFWCISRIHYSLVNGTKSYLYIFLICLGRFLLWQRYLMYSLKSTQFLSSCWRFEPRWIWLQDLELFFSPIQTVLMIVIPQLRIILCRFLVGRIILTLSNSFFINFFVDLNQYTNSFSLYFILFFNFYVQLVGKTL